MDAYEVEKVVGEGTWGVVSRAVSLFSHCVIFPIFSMIF